MNNNMNNMNNNMNNMNNNMNNMNNNMNNMNNNMNNMNNNNMNNMNNNNIHNNNMNNMNQMNNMNNNNQMNFNQNNQNNFGGQMNNQFNNNNMNNMNNLNNIKILKEIPKLGNKRDAILNICKMSIDNGKALPQVPEDITTKLKGKFDGEWFALITQIQNGNFDFKFSEFDNTLAFQYQGYEIYVCPLDLNQN